MHKDMTMTGHIVMHGHITMRRMHACMHEYITMQKSMIILYIIYAYMRAESENSSSGVIQPCRIKSMNIPINGLLQEFVVKRLTMTFFHLNHSDDTMIF
jgi:hypothetical protein